MGPLRIINILARLAFPGSLWFKESWTKVQINSRNHAQKRSIISEWMRIPNLRYPVIVIERKIIQQSVNEAELSDSFGVQETEYVKPDFVWEFCCHRYHPNSNWLSLYGGYSQRQSREALQHRAVGHFM